MGLPPHGSRYRTLKAEGPRFRYVRLCLIDQVKPDLRVSRLRGIGEYDGLLVRWWEDSTDWKSVVQMWGGFNLVPELETERGTHNLVDLTGPSR